MDDPGTAETVWRFDNYLALSTVEERLAAAGIGYSRHATTVSYFLSRNGQPWLDSYEVHVSYTGAILANGDPEVVKSYIRNRYGVIESPEGSRWIAESSGDSISEEAFYGMVLYARPDRVLSLQQLSFETASGQYLVELNLQSKILVLIGMGKTDHVPGMIADMVLPTVISRSDYLFELFAYNGGPLNS